MHPDERTRPKRPLSTHPRVLAILLRALLDFTPGPGSSLRRPPSESSPWSASGWHRCRSCRLHVASCPRGSDCSCPATGLAGGRGPGACRQCQGAGSWRGDPYDEQRRPLEPAQARSLPLPELERLCAPLDSVISDVPMGATALGAAINRLEPPPDRDRLLDQLAVEARERGDKPAFRGLQHALQALRLVAPVHWSAVDRAFVTQLEPVDRMGRRDQLLALDGLLVLAACLPDGWRAPRWARDQAEAELAAAAQERKARNGSGRWGDPDARRVRDREIARLSDAGFGARAIGRRLSVSHSTVVRVLQGREAA